MIFFNRINDTKKETKKVETSRKPKTKNTNKETEEITQKHD